MKVTNLFNFNVCHLMENKIRFTEESNIWRYSQRVDEKVLAVARYLLENRNFCINFITSL